MTGPASDGVAAESVADAVDTSNGEGGDAGEVSDETGGVTQEEIDAALGAKYKTAPPAAEEEAESDEEEATDENTEEADAESETTTEEEATEEKPVEKTETASDEPDFSFEVKDANDVTYKIKPGDDIEDILKDFEPKNNGQILAVLEQLREAKDAQAKHEADKADETAKAETTQRIADIQKGWEAEIKSLQADKRIPTTAKGADNERVAQVYQFMSEENDKRIAAGRPTIASFEDAFDKLENREAREAKVKAEKDAKETARKNGSLVGGSSAPASNSVPVYKAGSAMNSNQALRAMNLI